MNRPALAAAFVLVLGTFAFADDPPKTAETEAKAKTDALDLAMQGTSVDEKKAAISGCGAVPHALTANALAPLLEDASDEIRSAAAATLGQMPGIPEAAKALQEGIAPNEEKDAILISIFTGIAAVGQSSSIAVVKNWVEGKLKKKETAKLPTVDSGIECLGAIRHKKSVEQLIALLRVAEAFAPKPPKGSPPCAADSRIFAALSKLTGQGMQTSAEWTTWWKKNEGTYNDDLSMKTK